jgi:hypothetical protein
MAQTFMPRGMNSLPNGLQTSSFTWSMPGRAMIVGFGPSPGALWNTA